jgi:two-component system, response regulator PdtaR
LKNGSPKGDVDQVAPAPAVKATILVVEDEVLIRFMTAEDLRVVGYTVLEAGNAAEALSVLKSREPVDLVLTDVRMPGSMDGVKLASTVRGLWPATKIVVLSAYPPQPPAPEIVDGFVSKPYEPRLFVARIKELLKSDK